MKANKIRFLAGGLAAVVLMSNMATNVVFAEELDAPVAVEESAPAEESASAEENAPAEESTSSEESCSFEESVPAPAPEYAEPEVLVVPDPVPAPVDETAPVQTGETETSEAVPAPAPEYAEPEVFTEPVQAGEPEVVAAAVEETAPVSEEPIPEEVGTAKAGNFEENLYGEGTAHAGNCEEAVTAETDTQVDEEEVTVVKTSVMDIKGPKPKNGERRDSLRNITIEYSNGEKVRKYQTLDLEGNVVDEKIYRMTNGTEQLLETGDLAELRAYAQADRIAAENREREAKVAAYEKTLSEMSMAELVEYWKKVSTVNQKLADATTEDSGEEADAPEENAEDPEIVNMLKDMGMDAVKTLFDKVIGEAVGKFPGNEFYGDTVKDVIMKSMGIFVFGEETGKKDPDIEAAINKQTSDILKELEEMKKEMKDDNYNSNSFTTYNKQLDDFDSFVGSRMDEINTADDNSGYNDLQKLVRMAYTIGGEKGWLTGNSPVFDLMRKAGRILQGGETADKDDRSYFDLMYDYQKDSCLFVGEAMQKAESYIQVRLLRFSQSCSSVLDILNAQLQVCDLSEEQVASMDPVTRSLYDEILSSREAIESKIRMVAEIFTKPVKTDKKMVEASERTKSIFDTAKEYYSKDKTTYIGNKNYKNGINLADKISCMRGKDINQEAKQHFGGGVEGYYTSEELQKNIKAAKLSQADIAKIAKQAKEMNMTIKDYLAYCGFDVSDMGNAGYLVTKEYNMEHFDYWSGRGGKEKGASGYNANILKPIEENVMLIKYTDPDDPNKKEKVELTNDYKKFFFFVAE